MALSKINIILNQDNFKITNRSILERNNYGTTGSTTGYIISQSYNWSGVTSDNYMIYSKTSPDLFNKDIIYMTYGTLRQADSSNGIGGNFLKKLTPYISTNTNLLIAPIMQVRKSIKDETNGIYNLTFARANQTVSGDLFGNDPINSKNSYSCYAF